MIGLYDDRRMHGGTGRTKGVKQRQKRGNRKRKNERYGMPD